MQIYPAMRARMGDWNYYMVRMTMREVAREVQLASKLWEDQTLSDAIQRVLDESRVKQQIVNYLSRRDDRFFASLVVAAIGGNPTWTSEALPDSIHARAFRDTFGTLSFDEDPKYYALDGQHRLKAIQELLADPAGAPPGFEKEQISVLVVVREEQEIGEALWLQRYRRLFSSLNRYAKATDRDTNIIMDEDDIFAIVTRRLITDHHFFQAPGPEKESFRVQTKGKNLKEGAPHFISLQSLYDVNRTLLMTAERRRRRGRARDERIFLQFRPDETQIDRWYEELGRLWDALLEAVPDLREEPTKMRHHSLPDPNPDGLRDHLLFWPIGQQLFANIARSLLDNAGLDDSAPSGGFVETLRPLASVPWDLHGAPWRYLLVVAKAADEATWRMRNEDRKLALDIAERLLRWIGGLDALTAPDIDRLRLDWRDALIVNPERAEGLPRPDDLWPAVEAARERIVGGEAP